MPLFPEGQDPLDAAQGPALRAPMGQADPDPFAAQPTAVQSFGAAFRQNNPILSVIEAVGAQSPNQRYDPSYNPMAAIKGTPFEQDAGRFIGDPNESVTRARIAQMREEQAARETAAANGMAGLAGGLAGGVFDPSFYLPLVGEARGAGLIERAGRTALLGAAQSTVSSAALMASQQSRTAGDEAAGIATNTLLMGLLGGALGRLAPAERAEAANAMEAVRRDSTAINPLDRSSMSVEQHITPGDSGLSQGIEARAAELHAAGAAATPLEAAEAAHIEALPPEIASEAYGPTAQDGIAAAAERGGTRAEPDPEGYLGEPGGGREPAGGDGVGASTGDDGYAAAGNIDPFSLTSVSPHFDQAADSVASVAPRGEAAISELAKKEPRLTVDTPYRGKRRLTVAQVDSDIEREQRDLDRLVKYQRGEADEADKRFFDQRGAEQIGRDVNLTKSEIEALTKARERFATYEPSGVRGKPFVPAQMIDAGDRHVVSYAVDERHGASEGNHVFRVYDKPDTGAPARARDLGRSLGQVDISRGADGRWEVNMVHVEPRARGKGVATALYGAVQKELGIEMSPSGLLLPDGYEFWKKRAPEKVQFHQPVTTAEGGDYFMSPKRLGLLAESGGPDATVYRAKYDALPPEAKTQAALDAMFDLGPRASAGPQGAPDVHMVDQPVGSGDPTPENHIRAAAAPGGGDMMYVGRFRAGDGYVDRFADIGESGGGLSDFVHAFRSLAGESNLDPQLNASSLAMLRVFEHLGVGETPIYTLPTGHPLVRNANGVYSNNARIIALRDTGDHAQLLKTTVHEGLHAAFVKAISNDPSARQAVYEMLDLARLKNKDTGGQFSYFSTRGGRIINNPHYGLTNVDEYIAEAFSNPKFQRYLSSIEATPEMLKKIGLADLPSSKLSTLWNVLLMAMRKAIGMPLTDESLSLLDATMRYGDRLTRAAEDNLHLPEQARPQLGIGFREAAPAGAAVSDERDLNLKSFGLEKVAGVGAANAKLSPNLRVYSGTSTQAKRAMAGLADTALRFTQHDRGVATQEGGSLESRVRVQKARFQVAGHEALERAWVDHYYGDAKPNALRRGLDAVRDLRGQTPDGKLSYKDFKSAVYDATYSGDTHPIPQVEQAARDLRSKVFDPVKKMAQETLGPDGRPMLGEELSPPKGDQSFVPRAWNHDAVIAKRFQLKQTIADWLGGEQATKAAAKERIGDLQAQHAQLGGEVDKLERRLSSLSERQADTASRIKERAGERNAAIDRADTVEERQAKNRAALDELREFVGAIREHAVSDDDREQVSDFERQIARLEQHGHDLAARGQEAQVPRTRSGRRLDDLQERADRQALTRDLLDAARQNATDRQARVRGKIEDEIKGWKGSSSAEAISALKARDEADRIRGLKQQAGISDGAGGRLTSADGPVDRAVKRILGSDRDLSRGELADRADEIIDRIIGSPDGRISYDAASGGPKIGYTGGPKNEVRGSLRSRDFAIPTALVRDFVHTDMEHVVSSFLRTMLPDIALTERFGDVDMTDTFRRIQEEYARMIGPETTEAQSRDIAARRDSDISDVAAVRDKLRGVYGWNPDPAARKLGAIVRDFHAATSLASLGTSVANRLNDIGAQAVMRYGISNVFNDAWRPFFKSMVGMSPLAGIAKQQAREMGVGIDGLLGHLRHNLSDINDNYLPGNKFSRGLAWANDRSMLVNLHGPWTDWMKAMAWTPAQAELGRLADRVAAGSASAKDLARLADANIEPAMAARISRQLEAHSITADGVRLASAGEWTDLGARDAFERAMSREANINVITAGIGQKPNFLSKPLGGLIGQFKGFVAGAHENILLSNLQQRDGRTMQGMLVAMTMGMVSYRLYTLLAGQEASPRPQDWVKEGLARSALTGWFNEANNTLAKFTAGKVDYNRLYGADRPLTRRTENSPISELLGPTYSQLEGLTGIVTHTLSGHASAADVHAARHILPLQNLMGARIGFDSLEDGIDNALGFKPRNHSPHEWAPGPAAYPQ